MKKNKKLSLKKHSITKIGNRNKIVGGLSITPLQEGSTLIGGNPESFESETSYSIYGICDGSIPPQPENQ